MNERGYGGAIKRNEKMQGSGSKRGAALAAMQENLSMAFQNLRGHKGRSALVILGVSLGVTTLMAMVSIIEGLKGRLESEIMSTETTQIYLHADMRLKEQALAHASPTGLPPERFEPTDGLMEFLESL